MNILKISTFCKIVTRFIVLTSLFQLSSQVVLSQQTSVINSRLQFRLSDTIYNQIHKELQLSPEKSIGYSESEMMYYSPDKYVLRSVMNAFKDIRFTHRYSGSQSTSLLQNSNSIASVLRIGFGMTDISSGRMLPLEADSVWGAPFLDSNATSKNAFQAMLTTPMSEQYKRIWEDQYPEYIRKFIVRVFIGMEEANRWMLPVNKSVEPILTSGISRTVGKNVSERRNYIQNICYELASAPWSDNRFGQLATTKISSFELLDKFDRKSLAFATSVLFTHIDRAILEYTKNDSLFRLDSTVLKNFEGIVLYTSLGIVRILGTGNDQVNSQDFLCIDLGGNDLYRGRFASSIPLEQPISIVIDLDGNDTYDGSDTTLSIGSGLFGIGGVIDIKGNDQYIGKNSSIGCAWYGVGVVVDKEGNDTYTGSIWTQGAAHIGVGAIIDNSGNDIYSCAEQSQAMGSTLGAGIIVDVSGNDSYIARDDGNVSEMYLNQSVAMSQGVGYGRRADLGDGHSLAGGVGILVDGEGDDIYSSQVWSQGAGYWWGLGILEDLQGNDKYRNGKYSAGAGAHFAVGVFTDLFGNDEYNIGNQTAKNQYHGHARDGSIGIASDGFGNDKYFFKLHCGGSGDLGSIGFFWDQLGDDEYTYEFEDPKDGGGWTDAAPFGSTSLYPLFNSFRDDVITFGIFIDGNGKDSYKSELQIASLIQKNATIWKNFRSPNSRGIGIDK